MLMKSSVVIATGLLFVSCGSKSVEPDAQLASVSSSTLQLECLKMGDAGRTASSRDHVELTVSGSSVSVVRRLLTVSGETSQSKVQTLRGKINSVFDFNSISQNSLRLLLNPTSLETSVSGTKNETKYPYVLIEYANGQIKITEAQAKVVLSHSQCRTKSFNAAGVKPNTPNNG